MKVDLTKVLKDLKGEDFKEQDGTLIGIGKVVANILASGRADGNKNTDALRSYMLAVDLYNKESIDLNESDLSFIKEAIKSNGTYTPIVIGQLISYFNSLEKKDEQPS